MELGARELPDRHRRRGAPEIGLRVDAVLLSRRVAATSTRHVSGGTKRLSFFAITRTHWGNSPRKPRCARFPASPVVALAQAAAIRHVGVPSSRWARCGGGDVGLRWPFGARRHTAQPEVERSDSASRVRSARSVPDESSRTVHAATDVVHPLLATGAAESETERHFPACGAPDAAGRYPRDDTR